MKNSLSQSHPMVKFLFSMIVIILCFIVIFGIGFILAVPIFQVSLENLNSFLSDYSSPESIKFLKYLQTLQSIGLFIIPAFIVAYFLHPAMGGYLRLNVHFSGFSVFLTITLLLVLLPVINYMTVLNQSMDLPESLDGIERWMKEKEDMAYTLTLAFLKMGSLKALFFNIFMIAVLPAIGEELIFRGLLQKIFHEWTKSIHWAILISAILFSTMHFQFYGFLPRLFLGIVMGYLFYFGKSIWIPIIGHFVNNAIAVIVYYFFSEQVINELNGFGTSNGSYLYLLPSLLFGAIILYVLYKQTELNN